MIKDLNLACGAMGYAHHAKSQIDLAVGQALLPSVQETLKGMHPEFLKALGAKTSEPQAALGAFCEKKTAQDNRPSARPAASAKMSSNLTHGL